MAAPTPSPERDGSDEPSAWLRAKAQDLAKRLEGLRRRGGSADQVARLEQKLEVLRVELDITDLESGATLVDVDIDLDERRRAYWWGLGVFVAQVPLLLLAFVSVDSPVASGLWGHVTGLATAAIGAGALWKLVDVARDAPGRGGVFVGALLGLPAGLWVAAIIIPTLTAAGSLLYFGPLFAYYMVLVYGVLPAMAVGAAASWWRARRYGRQHGWFWRAMPLSGGLILQTILGAWFALAASVMAATAREAYARNAPGPGTLVLVAVLASLAWLQRRQRSV